MELLRPNHLRLQGYGPPLFLPRCLNSFLHLLHLFLSLNRTLYIVEIFYLLAFSYHSQGVRRMIWGGGSSLLAIIFTLTPSFTMPLPIFYSTITTKNIPNNNTPLIVFLDHNWESTNRLKEEKYPNILRLTKP